MMDDSVSSDGVVDQSVVILQLAHSHSHGYLLLASQLLYCLPLATHFC